MSRFDLGRLVRFAPLLGVIAIFMPAPAEAGGHRQRGVAASLQLYPAETIVYSQPDAGLYPSGAPWCYTFPIQAVYRFPAVIADQPGADVGYIRPNPTPGLLGGRPYLYHP